MLITHYGKRHYLVTCEGADARSAIGVRLIMQPTGALWHTGTSAAPGIYYDMPVTWLGYPGHCVQCPPEGVRIPLEPVPLSVAVWHWARLAVTGVRALLRRKR